MHEEPIFDHEKLDVYQIELLFNHLRFSVCERGGQPTISVTNHRSPPSFSSSSSFSGLFRSRTSTSTITRRNKGNYDE
jgi:hypothetical protein